MALDLDRSDIGVGKRDGVRRELREEVEGDVRPGVDGRDTFPHCFPVGKVLRVCRPVRSTGVVKREGVCRELREEDEGDMRLGVDGRGFCSI